MALADFGTQCKKRIGPEFYASLHVNFGKSIIHSLWSCGVVVRDGGWRGFPVTNTHFVSFENVGRKEKKVYLGSGLIVRNY